MGTVAIRRLQQRRHFDDVIRTNSLTVSGGITSVNGGVQLTSSQPSVSGTAAGGGRNNGGGNRKGDDQKLAWELLHSESFASWKYTAVLWGFDPRIDYMSNVKVNIIVNRA